MITLRERRRAADLSLGEAARKLGVMISEYSHWERGSGIPSAVQIKHLALMFNCTEDNIRSSLPTPEEAEREGQRIAASLDAFAAVLKDAKRLGLGKGRGGTGSVPCPACKTGTIRYRVAPQNGHTMGACSTETCVRWIQ